MGAGSSVAECAPRYLKDEGALAVSVILRSCSGVLHEDVVIPDPVLNPDVLVGPAVRPLCCFRVGGPPMVQSLSGLDSGFANGVPGYCWKAMSLCRQPCSVRREDGGVLIDVATSQQRRICVRCCTKCSSPHSREIELGFDPFVHFLLACFSSMYGWRTSASSRPGTDRNIGCFAF